jgi:hypothetical protein
MHQNPLEDLKDTHRLGENVWVTRNTALLIIHGIGNQNPLETIDQFARGLLNQLGTNIHVQHCVVPKQKQGDLPWFDNFLRVSRPGSDFHLDIYEYYWANYTQEKASFADIDQWLRGVAEGARSFYQENALMGKAYADSSPFFDEQGNFRSFRYRSFVYFASKTVVAYNAVKNFLLQVLSYIPVLGQITSASLASVEQSFASELTNVIGDITVYNTLDEKSKFYPVRKCILDGAINAIKFLLEKGYDTDLSYPRVIVAGHSLGSQIAYDALNRINHLINVGGLAPYKADGVYKGAHSSVTNVSDQLAGLITFGSPLDKIAFFLRENIPNEEYLRKQMAVSYHCFKQRNWSIGACYPVKIQKAFERHLEEVTWRNYYDDRDYVSGALDYYEGLTNVNCNFPSKNSDFTHSNYWNHPSFYNDIIHYYLV